VGQAIGLRGLSCAAITRTDSLIPNLTMRVGIFTPLLSQLPLDQVLKKLKTHKIETVELATGNYPGDAHCKLSMLDDRSALDRFKKTLADQGFSISALSCHGNPLHPDRDKAKHDQDVSRKTIRLAEKLGVPVVVDFSGCPGDSAKAKRPNWVTCPWPPEYLDTLNWQWEKVVEPYWTRQAKFAAGHGVKIAIEMHPGFVVYNPETMRKLRKIAGPTIGCNYDPSHMFWQGIDPIAAIRLLGDAIFHVHAKDTQIYDRNLPLTGVLDTKPYTDERHRAWIFRTCGYGHGEEWWREFASTLRMFGYDYVLSIEHEDSLLSAEEGLSKAAAFLHQIVPREKPGSAWWV
jgi:sugar phosphate isomerase/epimerase